MSCDTFIEYLGAPSAFSEIEETYLNSNEFNLYVRVVTRIISIFTCFIVISYIVFFKFYGKEKRKKKLDTWFEASIFSHLSDLNNDTGATSSPILKSLESIDKSPDLNIQSDGRSTSFEVTEIMLVQRGLENSMKNHYSYSPKNDFEIARETYIFNCHECFCECLCECWLQNCYKTRIKPFFRNFSQSTSLFFAKNVKFFYFYGLIVGGFLNHPLRNLGSFIVNECNKEYIGNNEVFSFLKVLFSIVDLICGSLAVILFLFTLSFLGTKDEFLKSYLFDKGYRARLIHFHLKKALFFGFFLMVFRIMTKIGFWDDFSLTDGPDSELSISTIILIHLYHERVINNTHRSGL